MQIFQMQYIEIIEKNQKQKKAKKNRISNEKKKSEFKIMLEK